METRTCINCGADLTGQHGSRVYCPKPECVKARDNKRQRKFQKEHPSYNNKYVYKYQDDNAEAIARKFEQKAINALDPEVKYYYAHLAVSFAVKAGLIERPETCSECGCEPGRRTNGAVGIDGHHTDYNKPLDVVWVCRKCHKTFHAVKQVA